MNVLHHRQNPLDSTKFKFNIFEGEMCARAIRKALPLVLGVHF
jgi:hypothetical protein